MTYGKRLLIALTLLLGLDVAPAQAQMDLLEDQAVPREMLARNRHDPALRKASAIVNGDVITDLDVDQRLALVVTASGNKVPPQEQARLRLQVLRNLINEQLQVQEARNNDVQIDPAQIDEAFVRVAKNFKQTPEEFSRYLRQNGTSARTLRSQIEAEFAWSRVLRRKVEPLVSIGDDEVQAVITRLTQAQGKEEMRVLELFLAATENTQDAVHETARRIVEQIKGGAPFMAYARQFSQGSSAAVGGDLGWLMPEQLRPGLREIAAKLPVGTVSQPIRVAGGWAIVQVNERRPVMGADPLEATLVTKQVTLKLPPGVTVSTAPEVVRDFVTKVTGSGGCGGMARLKDQPHIAITDLEARPVREFPQPLHQQLLDLRIGEVSRPFGSQTEASVLVLCGRDDAARPSLPSYDEVYAQINEQRLSLMARRYLRDLQRDAIVDYR